MSKPKKIFRVIAKMSDTLELYVEAEDIDQAWRMGKSADGSCFKILPDTEGSDWWIYDVFETKKDDVVKGFVTAEDLCFEEDSDE
jgi:hypothetical protein|tara:strand:+ start:243 stop:497 length:255 start_codon:yes stop_codon:yes gene_type:complete